MQGLTVFITGSSEGIGKQTALELARMGARVILHGRYAHKLEVARSEIADATNNSNVDFIAADLSNLSEVHQLADDVTARAPRLDVLINNAGVMISNRTITSDGYETTFAVNHLAHFLLTNLLLKHIKASAPARIITVSSQLHRSGTIDLDNLQLERRYNARAAYCNSKLANVLFSHELASRLNKSGVTSNSLHPGVIDTTLLRNHYGSLAGDPLPVGAETPVYLATSDEVSGVTGKYYSRKRVADTHPDADNLDLRHKLWDVSGELTGHAGYN